MFTGIITEVGTICRVSRDGRGAVFGVRAPRCAIDLAIGDSIAINGACHTVVSRTKTEFVVESMPETLARTNLGDLQIGSQVNLERPLAVNGRLDGHFVTGHIDATAQICRLQPDANATLIDLRIPKNLAKLVVAKGSVALDGISLTVIEIVGTRLRVGIIPHTLAATNLGTRQIGDRINLEIDLLAKHLAKLVGK